MICFANKFNVGETAYYAKGDTVKRIVVERVNFVMSAEYQKIQYCDTNGIWYEENKLQGSPEMAFYSQDNPVVDPVTEVEV